jgi:hypothetical protein
MADLVANGRGWFGSELALVPVTFPCARSGLHGVRSYGARI